jgi:hypothetical protein
MGCGKPRSLLDAPKKSNPELMNSLIDSLIESLTVKETPDTTTVEEGVETITETRIEYPHGSDRRRIARYKRQLLPFQGEVGNTTRSNSRTKLKKFKLTGWSS